MLSEYYKSMIAFFFMNISIGNLEIWYFEIFRNNDEFEFFTNLSAGNLEIFQNCVGLNVNFLIICFYWKFRSLIFGNFPKG